MLKSMNLLLKIKGPRSNCFQQCRRNHVFVLLLYTIVLVQLTSAHKRVQNEDLTIHKRTRIQYRSNLKKQHIRHARKLNATCLDGSDAVFYLSRNDHSRNWIIRLQAGGSCLSRQECINRQKTPFGSSRHMRRKKTGTFLTSDDPHHNPTFHKWNKVLIPYCSGDLFIGRKHGDWSSFKPHKLGHYIVTSVIKQLIRDYRINSKHSKILFGGASAGGVGMLGNIDHVAELVKPAQIFGYNDGGWFTLYPNYKEPTRRSAPETLQMLTNMFNLMWHGFVDETCRSQMAQPAACLFGEIVFQYLSTPIYVMVSQWDSYQIRELTSYKYSAVRLPPSSRNETLYLAKFGNNTHRSIRRLITSKHSGVFSPACVSHTFAGVNESEAIVTMKYNIKGVTAYNALSEWFKTRGERGTYAEVPLQYPRCNPTCCSRYCSVCRGLDETVQVVGPITSKKRIYLKTSNHGRQNGIQTSFILMQSVFMMYIGGWSS